MKKYLVILIISLTSFTTMANENSTEEINAQGQYKECVAVSLFTMQGRELNAIVENNRKIKETNVIPKGWSVIGVTTKKEAELTSPHIVICH